MLIRLRMRLCLREFPMDVGETRVQKSDVEAIDCPFDDFMGYDVDDFFLGWP